MDLLFLSEVVEETVQEPGVLDIIISFLNSGTVIATVLGLLIMGFAKSIISIFRMGVTFKSNLASKEELRNFETEIRADMRGYTTQIQKAVTEVCMRIINEKLKNIEDVGKSVEEMKILKAELEVEIKHAMEKIDEIKGIGDSVRTLGNKVSRMEFKNSTLTSERRTEK